MAITIGLDFGTHQTKICIENSDIPTHITYEFYDWGDGVFALPSIIQINADHTLRYGSFDLDTCLIAKKRKAINTINELILPPKPERPQVKRPRIYNVQPAPTTTRIIDGEKKTFLLSELYGIGKSYKPKEHFEEYIEWQLQCKNIEESYGNILENLEKLKVLCPEYPELNLTRPQYPSEPYLEGYDYDYDPILEATQLEISIYKEWEAQINMTNQINIEKKSEYENAMSLYRKSLLKWEKECEEITKKYEENKIRIEYSQEELPMIFRYFKQATFSTYKWDYEIPPEKLTILYLAYIIFKLEERFGTDFSIQMGVPASESTFGKLKTQASGYLIQAFSLVEKVFQNDIEKFLKTPYEELLKLIPPFLYTKKLKDENGLIILPEAYAALRSLTATSRIPKGMSVMLDIGGGTTDISFFVIDDKKEPELYHFASISKGLNFFLEFEENSSWHFNDFSIKREIADISKKTFKKAYNEFKKNIDLVIKSLTNFLHEDTIRRGFKKNAFKDAVSNRPAIYTGGGCSDIRMREPILDFTDVKYIDKNILAIPNVVREDKIDLPYSILATAFGLSIQRVDDEIIVAKKEDLFAPYNLREQDNHWDEHREHGMYED